MENDFFAFLNTLEGISFRKPTEEEMSKLRTISSTKLPDMFMEVYSNAMPADEVEFCDFVFYGIDRIIAENTDYIPGANIAPYGFFTFASTLDGDGICMDLNDSQFPVYQCSHSLLSNENKISYYKKKIITLEFNYENIIKFSPKLADGFSDFISKLIDDEVDTYSVIDIIKTL